ncbi:unnamed protein product [Adineta steineri]|uniref:UbiA prenyltransferase family protein n=1 Tax=Adineta steineri TaxID=433720 RepID=A0A814TNF9_9BILA|nr:unnamed protein product [Adineta steineri]CAF1162190.1 unnamed protein product [Adineta steineri]CAF1191095.1 unnamed protein product [Adineta steineri]CAF3696876.1 unnamed protein product [Adineta steineri]CAF3900502.1 unnamed protein product [Adineta steineri]
MFIVCPPCAIAATQLLSGHISISNLFYSWILSFIYLYFYIVQFNINNDITGVEGDRIDKPWRPIPSNRISIQRAWHLYYITVTIYLVYSYSIGHLFPCLIWTFTTIILNFTSIQNTSIGKNSMIAPATYAMVIVIWCLMNNVSNIYDHPKILWNIIFNSCITAAVAVQQDMRDVEGDRVQGRRTFSVTMGSPKAEQLIAKIIFCSLLLILIEASLVEQVRIVSKSIYMLINCILYGIMIIRNLFSYDVRKTYEFYHQLTFFFYLFMIPIIETN